MKKMQLPLDWKVVDLEDVGYIKARIGWRGLSKSEYTENGPYLVAGKHVKSGKVLWETADHITEDRYDESIEIALTKGDVIFSKDGTLGNPAFIDHLPGKATINGTMMLVRSKDTNILLPKFLYFNINSRQFDKLIYEKVSGSSVPHLFQRDMKKYKITLPSLKEQKKIANILSTWDRAIELKDRLINTKIELLDATIQRYKRKLFKGIDFGNWTTTKLKKVFSVRNEKDYESDDQPLYSFTIENGVSPKTDRYNRSFLVKGDKKYKVTKYNDLVYNPANLKYGAISVNKNAYSALISPIYETLYVNNPNKYDIDFFKYFLTTSEMISYYKSKVEGTLVERSAVKVEQFLLFSVDVPEYNVQKLVANHLNAIDKSIDILKRKKGLLEKQKKGLMQQLLTGKIRVQP